MNEQDLIAAEPLMECGNRLEFKQRLQWLSEGMLLNHLYPSDIYAINHDEIALYKKFKEAIEAEQISEILGLANDYSSLRGEIYSGDFKPLLKAMAEECRAIVKGEK